MGSFMNGVIIPVSAIRKEEFVCGSVGTLVHVALCECALAANAWRLRRYMSTANRHFVRLLSMFQTSFELT